MNMLQENFCQVRVRSEFRCSVFYIKSKKFLSAYILLFSFLQYANAYALCVPSNVTTIPIQYQKGSRLPVVAGKINGNDAIFLLDTGASWTYVMPSSLQKYSLFSVPTKSKSSGVAGESSTAITRVNSFEFGKERFERPYFFVLETLGFSPYFDVILGADYLYRSALEVDIRNSRLRLFDAGSCDINDLFKVKKNFFSVVMEPFNDDDPRPKFKLQIGKHTFTALIDTASSVSSISLQVAKKIGLPISFDSNENVVTISGVGGKTSAIPIAITSIEIGYQSIKHQGFMVPKVPRSGLPNETEILFGLDFLRKYNVIFDIKNRRIFFFE